MSSISSSFIPVSQSLDNIQDYEGFQYAVTEGGDPTLGGANVATPTTQANAVQLVNCSPCPLKLTYTLQPLAEKGQAAPAPVTKEVVYKAGEVNTIKFGSAVIVSVAVEEAVAAPADALTPDFGSATNAVASADLLANIRFLNC